MRNRNRSVKVRSKVWIEVEGEPVLGRGRRFLLEAIDTYGSISRAAKEINLSYRKSWCYLNAMEERLGVRLVERRVGGQNGGGATLTDAASDLIKKHKMMEEGMREIVDKRFRDIFPNGR